MWLGRYRANEREIRPLTGQTRCLSHSRHDAESGKRPSHIDRARAGDHVDGREDDWTGFVVFPNDAGDQGLSAIAFSVWSGRIDSRNAIGRGGMVKVGDGCGKRAGGDGRRGDIRCGDDAEDEKEFLVYFLSIALRSMVKNYP